MRGKCIVSLLAVVLMLSAVKSVHASINIHEILADPPTGLSGDANGDGVRSSKDDEFVELFNRSSSTMDISNWCLTDLTSIRHVFGRDSLIEPLSVIVVFAGGSPSFTTFHWQIAATNNLGLNNDGDTVSLFDADGALVDQVVYGPEAGNDQSIVRAIEGTD
ncbi:MAG: lamin tail domain-containing protein, partial [Candidatus Omnitrophica bacterium]|nr:lamin tail domain-containing protein [Candidatus Omnitrophota bacterium]